MAAPGDGPLGLKWSWYQPETFQFVRQAAGGWTFTEVEWCEVEPVRGQRDWSKVDDIVRRSLEFGHQPMLKLRTGQCWATEPPIGGTPDTTEATTKTPSTPPLDLSAYVAFVTDAVKRYAARDVHDYAIENEIDVLNFWAADVSAYEPLARAVAPAIRAADPQARVLDAGLSSTSYGVVLAAERLSAGDPEAALEIYQQHYQRRLSGGASRWPLVDSVAELRRVLTRTPAERSITAEDIAIRLVRDGVVDAYQLHYYESIGSLPGLLDHLRERLGRTPAIEAWEVGTAWPGTTYDEREHAQQVFDLVATLLAHDVRRIVYLPVAYTPGEKIQVFRGLTEESGAVLPAGYGWRELNAALLGLGDATIDQVTGSLTGVVWTVDGRSSAIVRATRETVALPGSAVERVVDATGVELPVDRPVGTTPVLVTGSVGEDLADRLNRT